MTEDNGAALLPASTIPVVGTGDGGISFNSKAEVAEALHEDTLFDGD